MTLFTPFEALLGCLGYSEHYVGQVKLAYLDPPFSSSQWSRYYDEAVEHSYWLTLMRDRLEQVRELLAPDGSVWVHCDDYEHAHLRVLMDELFGRANFVATVVWQKRYSRENRAAIGGVHDYLLVFSPAGADWREHRQRLPRDEKTSKQYRNPTNDPRGPWRVLPMTAQGYRPNQMYPITSPAGVVHHPPKGRCWSMVEERFEELRSQGRIYFGKDQRGAPGVIRYLDETEGLVPWTWWPSEEVGHNDESRKEILSLFPDHEPFATAKPERLLRRLVHIATKPGDTVLDCFVGSGTTAAVAHKMGRRWVCIERSRSTVQTYALPRLRKVVEGSDGGGITAAVEWEGGGGFEVLDVGPSMFEDDDGQVVLADWATNGKLAEATAAQLGFAHDPDPPMSGRQGRTRLAVIDGHISEAVVRLLVNVLDEGELLTVCGTSVDPQAVHELRTLRPGSRVRKIPDSLLAEYQANHRWRPQSVEARESDAASDGNASAAHLPEAAEAPS